MKWLSGSDSSPTEFDGSELEYNRPHPYLPDLVICRPDWAPTLMAAVAEHATAPTDSPRVAMARAYIRSLISHDASHVRLAADAWRVENGQRTGETGAEIRHRLEHGPEYRPLRRVRNLKFHEWGNNVVARFLLDIAAGGTDTTVSITEHFQTMARGIVDTTDLVYFATLLVVSLFLTHRSVESVRWR